MLDIKDDASLYDEFSALRKKQQADGDLPKWFTTGGLQTFVTKYLYGVDNYRQQIERVVKSLAKHSDNPEKWEKKFFEIIWNGWLALSSPVMSNSGTDRGMSVSCSGGYTVDSVDGFFESYKEVALLSKEGFGTSSYLSDVRARGSAYGVDGKSDGVIPVLNGHSMAVNQVSQGSSRRGAGAWYLKISHNDFDEVCETLLLKPDDYNIGWVITDDFIAKLEAGDKDSIRRFSRAMKVKLVTGKGYFFFVDKANRLTTQAIKNAGVPILASNLCVEIGLPANDELSFSCVLSSMNVSKYDEWKDTDAVFTATVFLDCVAQDLIEKARKVKGLEKVVRFTERYRALGLGALGFHTYLQEKMIPFESLAASAYNKIIFKQIHEQSKEASLWMGEKWGIPTACEGTGMRNATTMAIAPNLTSSLVCGGVSQGIEPVFMNAFMQKSAAGDIERINPVFLKLLKDKGLYSSEHPIKSKRFIDRIIDEKGSIQQMDEFTDLEKEVFKTAFEINQKMILRLANDRQMYIDQGQSINLFFDANEDEEYITHVHQEAFLNANIKGLYYIRSQAGVQASKNECESCQG